MAETYIAHCKSVLKGQGLRWSGPRSQICIVLNESNIPLTPADVERALKERFPEGDHHNVARVLKTIRELGLALEVFGGNVANPYPKGTPLDVHRYENGTVKVTELEGAVTHGKVKSVMLLTDEME